MIQIIDGIIIICLNCSKSLKISLVKQVQENEFYNQREKNLEASCGMGHKRETVNAKGYEFDA